MKIDWKLKGFNLLKFVCNKSLVLHPETCSEMLLMEHDGNLNLKDWITGNGTTEIESSLGDWLEANLTDVVVDPASNDTSDGLGNIVHHPGIVYPGTGLTVEDVEGKLSIVRATDSYFGGLKLGYNNTGHPNYLPLLLTEDSGQAYVDASSISVNNYIYKWNANIDNPTIETDIIPSVYIPNNNDAFSTINLYNYKDYYTNTLYNTPVNTTKCFPVRTDVNGHLYTYVPWNDTTYTFTSGINGFAVNNTSHSAFIHVTPYIQDNIIGSGIAGYLAKFDGTNHITTAVPLGSSTTKFLRNDGVWAIPSGMTATASIYNLPSEFADSEIEQYRILKENFEYGIEADIEEAINKSGAGKHSYINVTNSFTETDSDTLQSILTIINNKLHQYNNKGFQNLSYSFTIKFILKGTGGTGTNDTTANIQVAFPINNSGTPKAYKVDPNSVVSSFAIHSHTSSQLTTYTLDFTIGTSSTTSDKEYVIDVDLYQSIDTEIRWVIRTKAEAYSILMQ